MKLFAAITILTALAWLITGCCRYQKIPPGSPKFDTGPDTYFDGPDWIPHDQKTIGEPCADKCGRDGTSYVAAYIGAWPNFKVAYIPMKNKNFKTHNWPEGRDWPDEIVLDVGSNMPLDVKGCRATQTGVLYIRDDVVAKRIQEAIEDTKMAHYPEDAASVSMP